MADQDLISVIVPVFNEETNILPFYERLVAATSGLDARFEVIFVDDGSVDDTFERVRELASRDPRVKSLRLSRNFGSHPALTAGLRYAAGDAAVLISVDLQDPPELIATFLERWRQGYDVVWGVREGRDDPWLQKTLSNLFYKVVRSVAIPDYPAHGMDCGLLDRRVVDVINGFKEAHRILPPLLVWVGFRQTEVPYHRQARHSGEGKWSLAKRIKAAIDILVSFSSLPIRLISYFGLAVALISFLYAVFLITRRVVFGLGPTGWPSLMVAILFLGGVQMVMLGILGEYVWRSADQVRERPLFIVMDKIGIGEGEGQPVEGGG